MYRAIVADDEINILEGLVDVIENSPLSIRVIAKAQNGQQALDLINQYCPDIALLDINMPLLNGLEVIESLRKHHPKMVIVIISSYDNFEYAQQAIRLKVDAYVLKPIDEQQLIDVIGQCLQTMNTLDIKSNEVSEDDTLSSRLVTYINTHFNDLNLNSDMIEKEFGLSRTTIFKIMKTITDKSLNEYITTVRLRHAMALLKGSPSLSLKDIAMQCGYADSLYFSRVFKKQTGHSPSEYRAIILGEI